MANPAKFVTTGRELDKYVRDGFIVPDTRLPIEFTLTLIKGGTRIERKCYTRADTVARAEQLVRSVAAAIMTEDGYDSYEVMMR